MELEIKGDIIDDSDAFFYKWFGDRYTSPGKVKNVIKLCEKNNEDINVHIASPGGSVFAGIEIYNMLHDTKCKVNIKIEGLCASIASVIAMAGDCTMSNVASFMIHNVFCSTAGDYREMEHTAEVLKHTNEIIKNAYKSKTNLTDEELQNMMDKETWLTADEAKAKGFVDEVQKAKEEEQDKIQKNKMNLKNCYKNMKDKFELKNEILKKQKNQSNEEKVNSDFFIENLKNKLRLLKLKER